MALKIVQKTIKMKKITMLALLQILLLGTYVTSEYFIVICNYLFHN